MNNLDSHRRYRLPPRTIRMPDRSRDAFGARPAAFAPELFRGAAHICKHAAHAAVFPADATINAGEASMGVPPREVIIETPRLVLRRHRADDFPAYREMCADPEMARFSGKSPSGSEEAWMRLLRNIGHWSLMGYGFFAVEEKETGRLVGEAGLGDFRRQLGPALEGDPEAGWGIARSLQGRGYATEAAAAALAWIEAHFGVRRTICLIHAENIASIRVAEKLGYTPFGECAYRGYSAITFERLRAAG